MFKHLRKLLLLAALLVPWATQAQVSTTTVANGTTTNSYIPFYGTWMDDDQHNQFIYPASMVADLVGDSIVGMKFYLSSTATSAWGASATIKLGITGSTTLSGIDNTVDLTTVWTGTVNGTTTTIDITFDDAYPYVGGNLLVDITTITNGEYSSAYFYGVSQSSAAYYTYGSSGGGSQNFIPKTDFYHVEGDFMNCLPLAGITASDITTDGFTLSWNSSDDATSYLVYLDGDYVATVTSDTFYTFTGLTSNTVYSAGARSLCSSVDTSMLMAIPVKTACEVITTLPYNESFESSTTNSSSSPLNISCWTYNTNATTYYYPYLGGSSYNHTPGGSKGLYWYVTSTTSYGTYQILALPPVDTDIHPISTLGLHFWSRASAATYYPVFVVGVMTDPDDASTFVPVDTVHVEGINWDVYGTGPSKFANYTGDGQYLAVRSAYALTGSYWYAYVDDFSITDGWCELPQHPGCVADTDQLTLYWEPNGGTSFTVYLGTDTVENVTDTFYTFTGLTPNTAYNFGIANECDGELSLFRTGTVRTNCVPLTTLPWTETFEAAPTASSTTGFFAPCWTYNVPSSVTTFYPYVSSSSSYNHTPGGSRGLYWYNYYGPYQCLVLPTFDNEIYPINTLEVKFWARSSSTSYSPYLVVGAMSDPLDITTFDTIEVVSIGNSTVWKEYIVSFGNYDGEGTYMAIRANYTGTSWYVYLDDVTIEEVPNCPPINDLSVDAVTAGAAIVSWSYQPNVADPTEYNVEYGPIDGSESPTTETVQDTNFTLLGLTPGTNYYLKVQAVCDDGNGLWDSTTFNTVDLPCGLFDEDGIEAAIGEGTSTDPYLPAYGFYNYALSQQIYTKAEMGKSGKIEKISLMPSSAPLQRHLEIYLAHTTMTSLTSSFYVPSDSSELVKVYDGTPSLTAGEWYTFVLDSVFNYDTAEGNLMVCFRDMTGSYSTPYNYFYVHTNPNGSSRYLYQDSGPYDPYSPSGGTTTSYRNNIIFRGGDCLQIGSCSKPAVNVLYVGVDSVVINWIPGYDETEWSIDYRIAGVEEWTNYVSGVSDMSYEITGLSANTLYEIRVYHECDDTTFAGTTTFRTGCGLLSTLPFIEDFENQPTTSSSSKAFIPCWFKTSDATSYFYPYVSNSTTYNHTPGGNMGLYWYASTTTSYGNYNIVVLPGLDTEVIPMNKVRLTFWAKSSSTSYQPTFIIGALSDPEDESTFVGYDTIAPGLITTEWTKCVTRFDNFTADTCNYIGIRQNLPSSYWYAYVDDITLDEIPPCENVEDVTVTASATSAIVSWNSAGNTYQGAIVEWRDTVDDTWYSTTVYGQNYAILSNLTSEMPYSVHVTAICGEDTLSGTVNASFNTKSFPCIIVNPTQGFLDTIGNGTSTYSYLPTYNYYNYSFTEQIYTKEELGKSGPIHSISVMPATVNDDSRTVEIYMAHTNSTSLSDFEHPTDMTKVYGPAVVPYVVGQWATYDLDVAFNYDTSLGNLMIAFRDLTGVYTTANSFYVHSNNNGNSVYVYQDASSYDPYTVTGGTTTSYRNNMIINAQVCDSASACAAPPALVTAVTPYTVDVVWASGNTETSWNTYYRLQGDDTWITAATGVTDSSYQFTGLQGGLAYEFRIESVCDILTSTVVSATTECAAISQLPYTETFSNWGSGSGVIPNCWSRMGSYSTYSYISTSYNHSSVPGGSIYMYVSGLTYNSHIIMPALDTNVYQVKDVELVFYAFRTTTTSYVAPNFIVGVCDDNQDFTTFTPVDTVYHTAGMGAWQSFIVPLTNYTGNGTYVAVRTYSPSGYTYPYLDDFTLELTPACPRVDSLTSSGATTTSVDLSWTDYSGGSTTQWQIEYGPFGFVPGTGTLVTANSNPFTLTNPTCNSGVYYVRPICSSGDTSYWSLTNGTFYLAQTPATIPYDYDFESETEWNNWQGSTNVLTTAWTRGTAVADSGSYSMYVSADGGTTYAPYFNTAVVNTAAFRDIDFGTVDSSFRLSFRARVGGTIGYSYDGLMVFLVDPTQTPVASNSNITSPWGNVNDLYRIATVRENASWETYEASFDNISGIHRVAFFWFNQNTSSYTAINEPAAVDNIHIDYDPCPRPSNFTTIVANAHSATIGWQGPSSANYEVVYRVDGGTNQFTSCSTNQITLTGLDSMATYYMWVRKVCGAGDTSLWSDSYQFMTPLCDNGAVALNYDASMSSTTSSYAPVGYGTYGNTYVQTIIDSAFMASIGSYEIGYFGFNPVSNPSYGYLFTTMYVYMANVPESDLSAGFILSDDSVHVFQKVFDNANFTFTETGWQIHEMDTTFVWDGHSNVLVTVLRNHNAWSSSPSFSAHSTGSIKTRYAYRDNTPYTLDEPGGNISTGSYSGDIMLISCNAAPVCAAPTTLYASNVTYQSATLNWTGTATSYEVQYKAGTDAGWTGPVTVSSNSYQLTGLTDSTVYLFQVRSICTDEETGEDFYSDWADGTFTTLHLPCFAPSELEAQTVTYSTATLNWAENGVATQWNVHVWNTQFDSIYSATSHTFVVTGLTQTTIYNVAVSAQCGPETESEYGDTITIQTLTCQPPTGLTVTEKTATTATIVWGGSGIGFDVEYGDEHFSEGVNTQVVHVTGNTYMITGLEPEYDYSVSVRAECEAGVYSAYCAQVDFTTPAQGEGIENAGTANVTLYPNPTSNATTIAISGVNGEVEITLVDLSGRVVMTDSMSCTGDCAKKLEVSGLSQGAYFVRLSGENVNMVKKLIVK